MQQKLILEFTKMNGAGNDFIIIDNRFYHFSDQDLSDLARQYCTRRFGVGADGLLGFSTPVDEAHHYRMRYFNADGSLGTMCGNGARCLARFARLAGIDDNNLLFESDAGLYRAAASAGDGPVRLYVPGPRHFEPNKKLACDSASLTGPTHYIWTGVEHIVVMVESVEDTPVGTWGPDIRKDKNLQPAGANVNFVQVVGKGSEEERAALRVRTFEKGVEAETWACGTGALASAVVARLLNAVHSTTIDVQMPGGTLGVGFNLRENTVENLYLEGPAVVVYRGTLVL